jgi:hypothetical protein
MPQRSSKVKGVMQTCLHHALCSQKETPGYAGEYIKSSTFA